MPELWAKHWQTPDPVLRDAFRCVDAAWIEARTRHRVVRTLSSLENRVFELADETVLKMHRPNRWNRDELDEEHVFLADLDAAGVPVARVLDTGTVERIHFTRYPKIEGTILPENPDDALLVDLGRLLARIHEVGARRPATHRPTMDPIDFGLGNLRWVIDAIPTDLRARYAARVESIARSSEALYRSIPTHRVHGDFYRENCILGPRGDLVAIDFDDMMTGPAVQDVWILARLPSGNTDPVELSRRRDVILRGYREVRPFDDAWLALVPSLRALRAVWMSAWVTSRWFDPLFHESFPGWDAREHWEMQLDRFLEP